ncbi:MAG TPA: L,D-transpeptidase family protein, partial [Methylobacterium sp.]|nr:L,D-transpeptidase family protein [Methylobacterium sp.]
MPARLPLSSLRLRLGAGLSPLALACALGAAAAQGVPPGPIPGPAHAQTPAQGQNPGQSQGSIQGSIQGSNQGSNQAPNQGSGQPAGAQAPVAPAPVAAESAPAAPGGPAQPASAPVAEAPVPAPAKKREHAPLVYARVSTDPVPTVAPGTFLDTLRMAERYQAFVEAGGWESLPADLVLKPGARNPSVPSLRHHLTLTGDLPADAAPSDRFDPPLVAAVKAFQARHGLPETGILGRQTLAALNVPASVRQRQLAASANRLMGSNFPFGERYVIVNIPSATVEAVERGQVTRRYVAVVGSPDKATPTIETRITDINFNPTWTVPVSVVKNEIIPKMRKDAGWLARNHIRILGPGGVEVNPTAIDWKGEKAVNYTLRQDSGFDNSLGQVRIDMPNRHAVYMHDTPAKSFFAREVRFHSHGCVRVGQVKEFVGWLLEGTPGPNGSGSNWGPIEIETGIAAGDRRDIKPTKPIPVAFVYLTGYATPDGRAHFRDDIYNLDSPSPPAAAAVPDVQTTGAITPRATPPKAIPAPMPSRAAEDAAPEPAALKPSALKPAALKPSAPKLATPKPATLNLLAPKPEARTLAPEGLPAPKALPGSKAFPAPKAWPAPK